MRGPTSLNMVARKRETERIERENHAFAKRLFDKQATLQKKGYDKDWAKHMSYKRQISKMPKAYGQGAKTAAFNRRGMANVGFSTG